MQSILPRDFLPGSFSLLALAMLIAVCAGHIALVVSFLNIVYSRPWPRRLQSKLRHFIEIFLLGSPLLFLLTFDLAFPDLPPRTLGAALYTAYAKFCLFNGAVMVPFLTLQRWLRREPAASQEQTSMIVDVAKDLGFKPIGHGKHRKLACLPGNQCFEVEFSERVLRLPRLPAAWDGLSILHLTDLHLCGTPDLIFYQNLMDRCRELEPDLLVITGDIVDSRRHHRWIVPVLGRLRWKIAAFAILGNHDYWYDPRLSRRRLGKLGMQVLENRHHEIEIAGEKLIVIGHEGPWFTPEPDMSACPAGYRLCLSHTPDNIEWARQHHIDLMLAGHVHGGQIRFPVIGSVFVPSKYGRRFDCGLFELEPTTLFVSRGLGGQQPLRYFCRPEITRLVLRPALAQTASAGMDQARLSSTTMPPSRKRA